nr:hypothetical protein [uncultured Kingella sp.]
MAFGINGLEKQVGWALVAHAFYSQRQPENAWAASAHPTRNGVVCINTCVGW